MQTLNDPANPNRILLQYGHSWDWEVAVFYLSGAALFFSIFWLYMKVKRLDERVSNLEVGE